MITRLHGIGRGRLIAATTVIITTGLLVGLARVVFSHPVEAANEPGIVMTATPHIKSSQSSTTVGSTPEDDGSGGAEHPRGGDQDSEDDLTAQDQTPQAVDPDPPVAVDNGDVQPAPAAPTGPVVTERRSSDSRSDDDDDVKTTPKAVVGDGDDDRDKDGGDNDND